MATILYPTSEIELPNPKPRDWIASLPTYRLASLVRGKAAVTITDNTVASLANIVANAGGSWAQLGGTQSTVVAFQGVEGISAQTPIWISNPIRGVTIAGNITANVRASESALAANYGCYCFVYKVDGKDGTVTKIGYGGQVVELGTAEAGVSVTIVPTSTVLNDGDMIAIIFGYGSAGGTSASGRTASFVYNGLSGATGDTSVSFTETLVEMPVPPTAPTPLLIRLARFTRGLKRLHNNILNPADSVRIDYVDSVTIASVTSFSATETANHIDSATITSVTTLPQVKTPDLLTVDDVVDNFNRVESNPLSGLWVKRQVGSESNGFFADGNSAKQSLDGGFFPNVSAYEGPVLADSIACVTLQNPGTNQYIFARLQGATIFNGFNAYTFHLVFAASNDWVVQLLSWNSGIPTNLDFVIIPGPLNPGDKLAIRCIGSTIEGWYYTGGIWTLAVSAVDSTYSSGYSGLYANDSVTLASFDDFSLNYSSEVYIPAIPSLSSAPPTLRALLIKLAKNDNFKLLTPTPHPLPAPAFIYTDSATIASVTSLQSSENADYVDTPNSINGKTTVISTELAQDVDTATISSVTSFSSVEIAQYVDGATISGVTTPSSVDIADVVENATIASVTSFSSTEVANYVDSGTGASVTSPSGSELHETPDSGTISGSTSFSSSDTAQYVEAQVVTTQTTPSGSEIAAYIDASTVTSVTSLTSTDLYAAVDSGTGASVTTPTGTDTAQYVESGTISVVTTLSSTDTVDYVDFSTITSITTLTTVEIISAVSSPPQVLLIKLHRGRLKLLNNNILAPVPPVTYQETATISSVTSFSATETAQYVESGTINSVTIPSSVDAANTTESSTISGNTSVSIQDIAAFVDTSTISSVTTPIRTETTQYVDSGIPSSITTPFSVDIAQYVDSRSILGITTPGGTEGLSTPTLDTGFIPTITSLTPVEIFGVVETATIAGVTTIFSNEVLSYVEQGTPNSTTTPSSQEIADYVDTGFTSSITYVTGTEIYTPAPTYVETATITTVTTFSGYEYGPIIVVELVGTAFRRWASSATKRFDIVTGNKRWAANSLISRLHALATTRWNTWMT